MCAIAAATSSVTRAIAASEGLIVPARTMLTEKRLEWLPVCRANQDDGEVPNLSCLDQRERFGQLVERTKAPRQADERIGILEEQHFAHEKVPTEHPPIEKRIGGLFLRQFDIAADGPAASLPGAAVGRRHQPGTATRHDREPKPRKAATDLAPERIVRMRLVEACRAEHCHAGADEVEGAETENELPGDAEHEAQFLQAGVGSFEEDSLPSAAHSPNGVVFAGPSALFTASIVVSIVTRAEAS